MNRYDIAEVIELGEAHELILDQKQLSEQPIDNLGVPFRTDADTVDDFDE